MENHLLGMIPLISLLLQIAAAILALNLIAVTNWRFAWVPISAAVFLMASGKGYYLFRLAKPPANFADELLSLAVSVLLLAGIASVAPLFRAGRKGEQALRQSEERYRRMIDSAGEGVWLLDSNAHTIYVNRHMAEMLGYSVQEMLGKPLFHFMDSRARIVAEKSFKNHRLGIQDQHDFRFCRKDGSDLWTIFSTNLLADETGRYIGSLGMVTDITRRKKLENRIIQRAQLDLLTNLPNRSLLADRLNQAIAHGHRYRNLVAVLFIDLDRFKPINDTLGHRAGDLILKEVAQRLKSRVRQIDTVARYGGDEFVIVLQDLDNLQEAVGIAETFVHLLQRPFMVDDRVCQIGASIGISIYPTDGENSDILIGKADEAMYSAKRSEGKKFYFYSEPDPQAMNGTKADEFSSKGL